MQIITDFTTTNWSKGETTELFIFPNEASLSARNFDIRISIATISGNSIFTPFEGYNRVLTLLEGELELIHKENHTVTLLPFDQDHFKGGWTTKSSGVAKDFNVITKEKVETSVEVIHLRPGQTYLFEELKDINLIYIEEGEVEIDNKNVSHESLVLINNNPIQIKANISSVIITCSFQNND